MKRAQHADRLKHDESRRESSTWTNNCAQDKGNPATRFLALSVLLMALLFASNATANKRPSTQVQDEVPDSTATITSHLKIVGDPRIETLLQMHREESDRRRGFEGYRLQIYTGSGDDSKQEAYRVKARFLSLYPDVEAYVVFQAPEFKVRVGNFRDKSEALRARTRFQGEFFNAFLVEDFISLPDIITEEQATAE